MPFYKPKICSECKHKTYPIKDDDGIIWQNLLMIDIFSILLVFAFIALLLGFNQINTQCYTILENPCSYLVNHTCNNFNSFNISGVVINVEGISKGSDR